jgi:hypothetical protein
MQRHRREASADCLYFAYYQWYFFSARGSRLSPFALHFSPPDCLDRLFTPGKIEVKIASKFSSCKFSDACLDRL